MTKGHAPRRYELDCGHAVWFTLAPGKFDYIWCYRCRRMEAQLLSAASTHAEMLDPAGEYRAIRIGAKHKGECLYPLCSYESHSVSGFENLRLKMHQHYMREHTRFGAIEITVAERLPKNSPPPF